MNEVSALRRGPRKLPAPLHHLRSLGEAAACGPDIKPTGILVLDFPFSGTVKNKLLLYVSHPVYSVLLQQPKRI